MISTSSQLVRNGVELVGQTGRSLELIVKQVGDINSNVAALAEASREQAIGLKEVNVAVNSMNQATQQNAAMAEENTAASTDLAAQASSHRQALAQFKTRSHQTSSILRRPQISTSPHFLQRTHVSIRSAGRYRPCHSDWEEF